MLWMNLASSLILMNHSNSLLEWYIDSLLWKDLNSLLWQNLCSLLRLSNNLLDDSLLLRRPYSNNLLNGSNGLDLTILHKSLGKWSLCWDLRHIIINCWRSYPWSLDTLNSLSWVNGLNCWLADRLDLLVRLNGSLNCWLTDGSDLLERLNLDWCLNSSGCRNKRINRLYVWDKYWSVLNQVTVKSILLMLDMIAGQTWTLIIDFIINKVLLLNLYKAPWNGINTYPLNTL